MWLRNQGISPLESAESLCAGMFCGCVHEAEVWPCTICCKKQASWDGTNVVVWMHHINS